MFIYIVSGIAATALITGFLTINLKKYEEERESVNTAQSISNNNKFVNNIVNLDSTVGVNTNNNLSNSHFFKDKPITNKIVEVDKSERDLINRYSDAAKKLLASNPNTTITCSLLAGTNLISLDDCNKIHDKNFNFYHKTTDGNLAYKVENEKVNKYISKIESNRYNIEVEDVSKGENVYSIDKNFLSNQNKFINNKALIEKENKIVKIKNHIKNQDFLLASAMLYSIKQNSYDYTPLISDLYIKLLTDVEIKTKNASSSSSDYELRKNIQTEFLKLTKCSNIMENLNLENQEYAKAFINDIKLQFNNLVTSINKDVMPTPQEFQKSFDTLGANTTIIQ